MKIIVLLIIIYTLVYSITEEKCSSNGRFCLNEKQFSLCVYIGNKETHYEIHTRCIVTCPNGTICNMEGLLACINSSSREQQRNLSMIRSKTSIKTTETCKPTGRICLNEFQFMLCIYIGNDFIFEDEYVGCVVTCEKGSLCDDVGVNPCQKIKTTTIKNTEDTLTSSTVLPLTGCKPFGTLCLDERSFIFCIYVGNVLDYVYEYIGCILTCPINSACNDKGHIICVPNNITTSGNIFSTSPFSTMFPVVCKEGRFCLNKFEFITCIKIGNTLDYIIWFVGCIIKCPPSTICSENGRLVCITNNTTDITTTTMLFSTRGADIYTTTTVLTTTTTELATYAQTIDVRQNICTDGRICLNTIQFVFCIKSGNTTHFRFWFIGCIINCTEGSICTNNGIYICIDTLRSTITPCTTMEALTTSTTRKLTTTDIIPNECIGGRICLNSIQFLICIKIGNINQFSIWFIACTINCPEDSVCTNHGIYMCIYTVKPTTSPITTIKILTTASTERLTTRSTTTTNEIKPNDCIGDRICLSSVEFLTCIKVGNVTEYSIWLIGCVTNCPEGSICISQGIYMCIYTIRPTTSLTTTIPTSTSTERLTTRPTTTDMERPNECPEGRICLNSNQFITCIPVGNENEFNIWFIGCTIICPDGYVCTSHGMYMCIYTLRPTTSATTAIETITIATPKILTTQSTTTEIETNKCIDGRICINSEQFISCIKIGNINEFSIWFMSCIINCPEASVCTSHGIYMCIYTVKPTTSPTTVMETFITTTTKILTTTSPTTTMRIFTTASTERLTIQPTTTDIRRNDCPAGRICLNLDQFITCIEVGNESEFSIWFIGCTITCPDGSICTSHGMYVCIYTVRPTTSPTTIMEPLFTTTIKILTTRLTTIKIETNKCISGRICLNSVQFVTCIKVGNENEFKIWFIGCTITCPVGSVCTIHGMYICTYTSTPTTISITTASIWFIHRDVEPDDCIDGRICLTQTDFLLCVKVGNTRSYVKWFVGCTGVCPYGSVCVRFGIYVCIVIFPTKVASLQRKFLLKFTTSSTEYTSAITIRDLKIPTCNGPNKFPAPKCYQFYHCSRTWWKWIAVLRNCDVGTAFDKTLGYCTLKSGKKCKRPKVIHF